MSWSGTVRCGYCGHKGHNKITCPELSSKAARMSDAIRREEESNPSSGHLSAYDIARKYSVPYSCYRAWEEIQARTNRTKFGRRCSWCKAQGHNRKTCQNFKEFKETILIANGIFIRKVAKVFSDQNIFVGGLVNLTSEVYNHKELKWLKVSNIAIITEIKFNRYNVLNYILNKQQDRPSVCVHNMNGKRINIVPYFENLGSKLKIGSYHLNNWPQNIVALSKPPPHADILLNHALSCFKKEVNEHLKGFNEKDFAKEQLIGKSRQDRLDGLLGATNESR